MCSPPVGCAGRGDGRVLLLPRPRRRAALRHRAAAGHSYVRCTACASDPPCRFTNTTRTGWCARADTGDVEVQARDTQVRGRPAERLAVARLRPSAEKLRPAGGRARRKTALVASYQRWGQPQQLRFPLAAGTPLRLPPARAQGLLLPEARRGRLPLPPGKASAHTPPARPRSAQVTDLLV